jgi:hypothetical protein
MLQCVMLALRLRVSGLKLALCAIHDTLQTKDWLYCSMQQYKCEMTISQETICLVRFFSKLYFVICEARSFLYWKGNFPKFEILWIVFLGRSSGYNTVP